MSVSQPWRAKAHPREGLVVWLLAGGAVLFGAACIYAAAAMEFSPVFLLAIPVIALGGVAVLANTQAGLVFAAFAIVPLGIVQVEAAGVTINLPEALILALVLKEALRFAIAGERPSDMAPWLPLGLYAAASVAGIFTGLLYGNGAARVLQDFRQFTEYIVLYLLVVHRVTTRRQAVQILAAFAAGGLAVALHGIAQRYTAIGIPGLQRLSDLVFHGEVRSGSFYGSTPLGAIMVLSLGPTLGLLLSVRSYFLRAALSGMAAVLVTAAVFTNTRASWLAIGVLVLFMFLTVRKTPAMIVFSVAAVLIFTAALGPAVYKRLSTLRATKSERSLVERIHYYTAARHIFAAHPVFGLGWGCYYDVKDIVTNGKYVPRKPHELPKHVHKSAVTVHSAYLQILVKAGALALATFGLFLAAWFGMVWREYWARDRMEMDHRLFAGVAGGLVGYLFHSTFENFFQWPVMAQSFWLLAGVSTVLGVRIARQGRVDAPPSAPAGA